MGTAVIAGVTGAIFFPFLPGIEGRLATLITYFGGAFTFGMLTASNGISSEIKTVLDPEAFEEALQAFESRVDEEEEAGRPSPGFVVVQFVNEGKSYEALRRENLSSIMSENGYTQEAGNLLE